VAFGCLLLGGAAILSNYNDFQRFGHGAEEMRVFVLVLDSANAISAERGPANVAMAAKPSELDEALVALEQSRAKTDDAIAVMIEALTLHHVDDQARLTAITEVLESLNTGRMAVDKVVAVPLEARTTLHVPLAIMAMFRAADSAADLRNEVSGHLVPTTPQIAGEVLLASSASALREQAGRLGSYVVMTLVAPRDEDANYALLMDKTSAIILNIWESGLNNAALFSGNDTIASLVERVEAEYLDDAMPMAIATAHIMGPTNGMSGGSFTEVYVPGMASLESLRNELVELSLTMLETRRLQARQAMIDSALLTALVISVLIGVGAMFRRGLFTPLLALHGEVVALASGDLTTPPKAGNAAREVNDIFEGLAILRENQREKRRLEGLQRQMNLRLKRLSETDTLTGLLNRRALVQRADALFRRAKITGEDMAVVLFDIDHFKNVNDTHGHSVGDEVLAGVAREIGLLTRPTDAFARLGGEEFVIILRRVDLEQAISIVTHFKNQLHRNPVQQPLQLKITASFGIAMRLADSDESWDEIFRRADQHLYAAKNAGRDRIVSDSADTAQRIA
jgi:diguanylate cyclase (GGDEF)-like protein